MKIGRILGLFAVALVGALAAVVIYAKFIKPNHGLWRYRWRARSDM